MAFVLFIVVDFIILLLAVILVSPYWALLFLIVSALLRNWDNQVRIKQRVSHFCRLKDEKLC